VALPFFMDLKNCMTASITLFTAYTLDGPINRQLAGYISANPAYDRFTRHQTHSTKGESFHVSNEQLYYSLCRIRGGTVGSIFRRCPYYPRR
jgi:hypothetical protein